VRRRLFNTFGARRLNSSSSVKGAYRISEKNGIDDAIAFSASLFQANEKLKLEKSLHAEKDLRLFFLNDENPAKLYWDEVCVAEKKHYFARQCDYLMHLSYITDSPTSILGVTKLASILDVPYERLRDALRPVDSAKYQPFGEPSLKHIHFKAIRSKYGNKFELSYMF
jgi:hypothetical protein